MKSSFGDELECALRRDQGATEIAGVAGSARAHHDIHGRLTELAHSNGVHETYSYGISQRPDSCVRSDTVTRFSYDGVRRLASVEVEGAFVERYERDAEGRLTSVARDGAASHARYRYDADGNRSAGDVASRYGAGNRLHSFGVEKFKYDRRGRMVERATATGEACKYGYTVDGLLSEVEGADVRANYRYDALGRRIAKIVNGKETRFAWEGNRVCHEWRPDGEERNYTYRFGSMTPLFMHRRVLGGEWEPYFFHNDHRGCPVALTDGAGAEVWRARVDAFGAVEHEVGALDQPLGLPGQYRDAETGLAYNFFRYYDPRLTSYITPDPIGHVGGQHLYAYAADPISKIDPLGLSTADYDTSQRTPHALVIVIDDYGHEADDMGKQTKFVEFEAKTGFAYDNDHINLNGSGDPKTGSEEARAALGPNGEVVVIEGRHRSVSAAANDPIEERLGGIPERPGHLRYPLGRDGAWETVNAQDVGPSLGDMANNPDTLARARSGKRKP